MLSRIAESLFWIGRYIERADNTARFLDVHLRLLVEDPWKTESEACQDLLSLMGVESDEPSREALVQLLAYNPASPASIFSCWRAARDNARRAREVIPSELWEVINTTWHQLPSRTGVGGQAGFLAWARERSALFTGTSRATVVRDEGWQFLSLGRHLEQADMTARLVSGAKLVGSNPWPAVLRGCGAHDAFLRTYRGLQGERDAAEFLVQDDRFPRSVMYGISGASHCLAQISPPSGEGGRREPGHDAQHLLGRLQARLTYTPVGDLLDNLNDHMAEVEEGCDTVTRIISQTFFSVSDPTAWTTEGVA